MINAYEAYNLALENSQQIQQEQREKADEFIEKTISPLIDAAVAKGEFFIEQKLAINDSCVNNLAAIKIMIQSKGYYCDYLKTRSKTEEFFILTIKWC